MKNKHIYFVIIALSTLASCKKNSETLPKSFEKKMSLSEPTSTLYEPLTVITIAGKLYKTGYADGTGEQARFNILGGIDLTDDGNLYVCDMGNNKIRKITPAGVVSTVNIPAVANGNAFIRPKCVQVSKDGTLNILRDPYFNDTYVVWIVKPNGQILTPQSHNKYYRYFDLQPDPYNETIWLGGARTIASRPVIEKFKIGDDGRIGTNPYHAPIDSLTGDGKRYPYITSLFCAANGVKYIVINNTHIYKYTKSGVFTQIFRSLKFNYITSIIANRDSRSIYIADKGDIKTITDGKLTYLVGYNRVSEQLDGVGNKASVYAIYLALSNDENTIYFTDASSRVRKLILR